MRLGGPLASRLALSSACSWAVACGTTSSAGPGDASTGDAGSSPVADAHAVDDPTAWKSGKRLRAKVMDGSYGAKLFESWQDTLLQISCSFATADDGVVRCLPLEEDTSVILRIFAEEKCTQHIALGPPPDEPVVRISDAPCGPSDYDGQSHRVVKWGEFVDVENPWVLRNGVCSPILNAPSFAWRSIEVLDPSLFVAANEVVHASPEGLGIRVLSAEDGSRENSRMIDMATQKPCEVVSDHVIGAPEKCIPMPWGVSSAQPYFDGPACDRAIAFARSCDRADTAVVLQHSECGTTVALAEMGPAVQTDGGGLYRRYISGGCQSAFLDDPIAGYEIGRTISADSFRRAPDEVLGMDRLQVRLHRLTDGMRVKNTRLLPIRSLLDPDNWTSAVQPPMYRFFDTARQTNCFVSETADGTLRCLPISTIPRLGRYFGDPACTLPIHIGSNDPNCLSTGFVSLPGWQEVGQSLPPITDIRAIGPVLQTATYAIARNDGDPNAPPAGTCVEQPKESSRVYYTLSDPIPTTELAQVTERVE